MGGFGALAVSRVYTFARNDGGHFEVNSVQEHEQRATVHSAQAKVWVMCWKCDEIDKVILHYRN